MPSRTLSVVIAPEPAFEAVRRSWLGVIGAWIKQVLCGVFGHEYQLHAASDRMYLQCALCDHQTPGWTLGVLALPQRHRRPRANAA